METTMKRFLNNVFAALKRTSEPRTADRPQRPSPTPVLEVRSRIKAGTPMESVSLN
jgi:hypothetical protein